MIAHDNHYESEVEEEEISTKEEVTKCLKCGGRMEFLSDMNLYSCDECGEIDENLNFKATWDGSFGGAGTMVTESSNSIRMKTAQTRYAKIPYARRQKSRLYSKLSTKAESLGFNTRHINQVKGYLESYFSKQLKTRMGRHVPQFKTIGVNKICERTVVAIIYLVARKNRFAIALGEVCSLWGHSPLDVGKLLRVVENTEKLTSHTLTASEYLPRLINRLRLISNRKDRKVLDFHLGPEFPRLTDGQKAEIQGNLDNLLRVADTFGSAEGKSAIDSACSILHIACEASKFELSIEKLCKTFCLSEFHLRKRVRDMKKHLEALISEILGEEFSKTMARGHNILWMIRHAPTMISVKAKVNEKQGKGIKRKLQDAARNMKGSRPKRIRNMINQMERKEILACAYREMKESGKYETIQVLEDPKLKPDKPPSEKTLKSAQELLRLDGLTIHEIITSNKPFFKLVAEVKEKRKNEVEVNLDDDDFGDVNDSDLDQYFVSDENPSD